MSPADRICELLRYVHAVFTDPETPRYGTWVREQRTQTSNGGQ